MSCVVFRIVILLYELVCMGCRCYGYILHCFFRDFVLLLGIFFIGYALIVIFDGMGLIKLLSMLLNYSAFLPVRLLPFLSLLPASFP